MASYTGPCNCKDSISYFNNISYPTNTTTLIANHPTTITWDPRNATSVSFRLFSIEGLCYITPSTGYHDCKSRNNIVADIVRQVPDTGSVMWTPGADLQSREDYWIDGRYDYFVDGKIYSTVGMGSMYFTVLKKEGDQVLVLPDAMGIQKSLRASASASASGSGSVIVATTSVTPSETSAASPAPTSSVTAGSGAGSNCKMRWWSVAICVGVIVALHV
jgi:hypothetical protein